MSSSPSVLVALLKDRTDRAILQRQLWYRIPVESAPRLISERRVTIMGFYLPAAFGDELKFKIHEFGRVRKIVEASRRELFPEEPPGGAKAHKRYYKIELESVHPLPQPIVSRRGHRLLFVPTTEEKFFNTTDLNTLFHTGPLEDRLYRKLQSQRIATERQWLEEVDKEHRYWLDFAIFCNDGAIDVECGDARYHTAPDQRRYDKNRNKELAGRGWSVLRYPTEILKTRMDYVMEEIAGEVSRRNGPASSGR